MIAKFTANIIMGTTPLNHNIEVIYNIKGNPRQQEDMPTASDMPTYLQLPLAHNTYSKIAKLQLKFIMGTTPKNNNKEVI